MLNDESMEPLEWPSGPITRSRAKKFKTVLFAHVQKLLVESGLHSNIEGVPCLITIIYACLD